MRRILSILTDSQLCFRHEWLNILWTTWTRCSSLVWVSAGAQCACAVQQHQFPSGRQRARGGSVWLWTCSSSKCFPAPDARAWLVISTATASHELPTWSIRVESDLSVKSTGGDRDALFTEESCILQVQVKAYLLDPILVSTESHRDGWWPAAVWSWSRTFTFRGSRIARGWGECVAAKNKELDLVSAVRNIAQELSAAGYVLVNGIEGYPS